MAPSAQYVLDVVEYQLFHVQQLDPTQHILTINGEPIPRDLRCRELDGRIVKCEHIDKVLVELEAKTDATQATFLATNAQDDKNVAARAIARTAARDADVKLGQAHLTSYYARIDEQNARTNHENAMAALRAAEATCLESSNETYRTHDAFVTAFNDLKDYHAGEKRKRL